MKLQTSTATTQTTNSIPLPLSKATEWSVDADWTATSYDAKTALTGKQHVFTITFPAKAAATDGDYVIIPDVDNALFWAISLDTTGSAEEPTGASWVSVPAANKVHVDISACTTAASVAAAVETAFDALEDVTFATDDSAANGTMTFTSATRVGLSDGAVHNEDDSGAGSIAIASSTGGVASAVDVTANTIAVPSHGMITGLKAAVTISGGGTLPAGLSATMYVIKVDAFSIKLATSYANAIAGIEADITGQGTADKTLTVTPAAIGTVTMKLQCSNDAASWYDISGATQSLASSGSKIWDSSMTSSMPKGVAYIRAVCTMTSGEGSFDINIRGVEK